ncbi:hypothetical protein BH18ACI4_BH18ACI4_01190 [soil metagenome]
MRPLAFKYNFWSSERSRKMVGGFGAINIQPLTG